MKNLYARFAIAIIVIGSLAGGAYYMGTKNGNKNTVVPIKSNDNTKAVANNDTKPVAVTATGSTKSDINKYEAAGLLNASMTRKLTDFTAWQDSTVSVEYRDFNQDGISDAFVQAKVPGTMGYSFAAVWTLGNDNKPKELWYLATDQYIAQSSWAVDSINTLVNSGKEEVGGTIKTKVNNWHWQVATTGSGFVLEPNT